MATPTEQIVRARLGAARVLLARVHGAPNHKAVSAIQASAVIEGLRGLKPSAEIAASLTDRILEVNWAEEDTQRVLQALKPMETRIGRRASQDYEAVVNYATQDTHPFTRIYPPTRRPAFALSPRPQPKPTLAPISIPTLAPLAIARC